MKALLPGLLTFTLASFAASAQTLTVNAVPQQSKVYARNVKNGQRYLLGETPYKTNINKLQTSFDLKNSFIIEVEKEGYLPYNVHIGLIKKTNIELTATLKLKAEDMINQSHRYDKVISKLFDAQRMARAKSYEQALSALDAIKDDAKYLSTYYEIKAGTLYLKKDFNGALANYRKAYSLNEDNLDAYSMKKYLEKAFGGKKK